LSFVKERRHWRHARHQEKEDDAPIAAHLRAINHQGRHATIIIIIITQRSTS